MGDQSREHDAFVYAAPEIESQFLQRPGHVDG